MLIILSRMNQKKSCGIDTKAHWIFQFDDKNDMTMNVGRQYIDVNWSIYSKPFCDFLIKWGYQFDGDYQWHWPASIVWRRIVYDNKTTLSDQHSAKRHYHFFNASLKVFSSVAMHDLLQYAQIHAHFHLIDFTAVFNRPCNEF